MSDEGENADDCRELPVPAYGGIYFPGFYGGLKPERLMKHGSATVIDFDDLGFLAGLMVADHELLVSFLCKIIYLDPCLELHRKVVAAGLKKSKRGQFDDNPSSIRRIGARSIRSFGSFPAGCPPSSAPPSILGLMTAPLPYPLPTYRHACRLVIVCFVVLAHRAGSVVYNEYIIAHPVDCSARLEAGLVAGRVT